MEGCAKRRRMGDDRGYVGKDRVELLDSGREKGGRADRRECENENER